MLMHAGPQSIASYCLTKGYVIESAEWNFECVNISNYLRGRGRTAAFVVDSFFQESIAEIVYLPIKPLAWDYSESFRTLTSLMVSGGRTTGF
jgi:hypothetical protein